ncbi:MAG TPA: dienelactone hydrolase family protein [Spirochaetia bacterium]|nr:dienelactone hydrolase family protein [Spirochaetia bacterium]
MRNSLGASGALAVVMLVGAASVAVAQAATLPPTEAQAKARLDTSPRHGEWVTVDAGSGDKVDAWVVYPERADRAPVVLVVHEIFGLSDWVRATADQLAAEGYIAVAPDLISGKAPGGQGSRAVGPDDARALIARLDPEEVTRRLNAVEAWATSQPAALPRFGVIGFCWGGGVSFGYAATQPALGASVVYYGTPPTDQAMAQIKAPVLAFYGGSDARVTMTAAPTAQTMKKLGKSFDYAVYDGAGHAFARAQDGMSGANRKAIQQAWPRTLAFLKKNLDSGMSRAAPGPSELQRAVFAMRCWCDGGDSPAIAMR